MKTVSYKNFILGTFILSLLIFIGYRHYLERKADSIHIAFAGPLSGEGAKAGKLMTQAIELYLEGINAKGGIHGKKIVLDQFDDENDPDKATEKALEIANESQAVAVIGHWYSSASISAGQVYKKYAVPAITPGSENVQVTENNEWYFRNIYNTNASGQFLANYVKKVFGQNTVTIIHEDAAFGAYLAKVFKETALNLDMDVKNEWHYNKKTQDLDQLFPHIVQQLQAMKEEAGVVLLAVQAVEGVKLVKLIKDAGIQSTLIGASSFSEETFRKGFDEFPAEKITPGYYTSNIYVATPLIFDTANEQAQHFREAFQETYREEPDWSAAYAYDTAMLLLEAIKQAHIQGKPGTLQTDRKKIRDMLASYTDPDIAREGTTGFNYFDNNRDAQKTVSLGVYRQKDSISALTQLNPVRYASEIPNLETALTEERILVINDRYMYRTGVVYTGIELNEIKDIDLQALTCYLDFYLWFRFQGQFEPQKIEFANAAESVALGEPLVEKVSDDISYYLYRVKGQFKIDFINRFFYKKHNLGISFYHRELTRNNLIYVADVLGMGLADEKKLLKDMKKRQVLNSALGWEINHFWFFENIIKESSLGDPKYLQIKEGQVEYSQFNAGIRIQKNELSLRGMLPYRYSDELMALSGIVMLLLAIVGNQLKRFSKVIWFFQVIFASLLLLTGEVILVNWLSEHTTQPHLKSIIRTFDVLWWIIPAFLLTTASERFIWTPLEEQVGPIPNIIRHFFALIIYFLAIIGISVFVYERRFVTLLATSSMLAMIIGLAIKINISNIFSGIVINIERPFRIGDWVKIRAFEEGEIVDINWRATRMQLRNRVIESIPNTLAAESPIVNFYYPRRAFWLWPTVYVHPRHPPERVKKVLLDALLSVESILRDPPPFIMFMGVNEWAASYWIVICANDYEQKNYILSDVWTRVWFHLSRAAIQPAVRRQEVYLFRGYAGTQYDPALFDTSFDEVDSHAPEEEQFTYPIKNKR